MSGAPLFKGKRSENLLGYSQAPTSLNDEVSDTTSLTSTQTMRKKPSTEHPPKGGKFNNTAELTGKSMLGDSKKAAAARKPPT